MQCRAPQKRSRLRWCCLDMHVCVNFVFVVGVGRAKKEERILTVDSVAVHEQGAACAEVEGDRV